MAHPDASLAFAFILLAVLCIACATPRRSPPPECDCKELRDHISNLETELALCRATPADDIASPPPGDCGKADDCD